eukprot:9315973-Ditylum_brightwellii.AAC.1
MSVISEDIITITEHKSDNISVRSMPDLMPHADNDGNSSVESKCNDKHPDDGFFADGVGSVNMEELWDSDYQMSDDERDDYSRN